MVFDQFYVAVVFEASRIFLLKQNYFINFARLIQPDTWDIKCHLRSISGPVFSNIFSIYKSHSFKGQIISEDIFCLQFFQIVLISALAFKIGQIKKKCKNFMSFNVRYFLLDPF